MSQFQSCPHCGEAAAGNISEVYINLHKCNDCGEVFCNSCVEGSNDECPECGSNDIWWNYVQAYAE